MSRVRRVSSVSMISDQNKYKSEGIMDKVSRVRRVLEIWGTLSLGDLGDWGIGATGLCPIFHPEIAHLVT